MTLQKETLSEKDMDENNLVQALRNGNNLAAEQLYDKYAANIYGIIFRIVKSEELAEDIMQEVFLKIWHSIKNYDSSKGKLFTWMLNIARNKAIDATRSKDFKISKSTYDISHIDLEVNENGEEKRVGENYNLKDIIRYLKPNHRKVIDMVYFNGYTHVETAQELELPLGTVKTRIRSALNELKEIVSK